MMENEGWMIKIKNDDITINNIKDGIIMEMEHKK